MGIPEPSDQQENLYILTQKKQKKLILNITS